MNPFKIAVPAALGLVLAAAGAASGVEDIPFTYTVSPSTAGAVASSTAKASTTYDGTIGTASSATFHLAPGTKIAYADDATSPVSPPPVNGDQVGSVAVSADPTLDGCGNPINVTATATWVDPISASAPAGAVAQFHVHGSYLFYTFDSDGFVVPSAGDDLQPLPHYDLLPGSLDSGSTTLCTGSQVGLTVTTYGYAKSSTGGKTRRITQVNPSETGTKTVYVDAVDGSGVRHTGSASYEITAH